MANSSASLASEFTVPIHNVTKLLRTCLGIGGIISDKVVHDIFEHTGGHAYVMRVLLGEIAKDGRLVPLKAIVPQRSDLLNVVFERSFTKLSEGGRWVFLCVANWRSVVPELFLLVVLGPREVDVEGGLEECLRLALLDRHEFADGSYGYGAPELARLFARKKLEGDPDRLLMQEDMEALRQFGPLATTSVTSTETQTIVSAFIGRCVVSAQPGDTARSQRTDALIERIAELWPRAWIGLAQFRESVKDTPDRVGHALRRAVEEMPYDKTVWLERAAFAFRQHDAATRVASLVSAVEADPNDVDLVRRTAAILCEYVDAHKSEIPQARRGVYLASVRSHMERLADQLDATGLSRLAWLFLLEGDQHGARKFANLGLSKDSTNAHCLKIAERLDGQGYVPPR